MKVKVMNLRNNSTMKKPYLFIILVACLFLTGCLNSLTPSTEYIPVLDVEPTATYDWMKGESPVPVQRIGVYRAGITETSHTVSPNGVYYLETNRFDSANNGKENDSTYIMYSDHGSDTFVKLCGRPDCSHNNPDCNAYVQKGSDISFYNGYLYVVSGEGSDSGDCYLMRMNPDGSNHVIIFDFAKYIKEIDADYVECAFISKGYCVFNPHKWKTTNEDTYKGISIGYQIFKLDGTIEKPKVVNNTGWLLYNCGDVFLSNQLGILNGEEIEVYYDWNPETDTSTFLTNHPGVPGYFGKEEAYYFKEGNICRLTYKTQTEEVMVETGLEGNYYLFAFPDCMVVASRAGQTDRNLYIYNWAFELVDIIKVSYESTSSVKFLLIAETAERFILASERYDSPAYYVNKSELGTGEVKIHPFKIT